MLQALFSLVGSSNGGVFDVTVISWEDRAR